MSRITFCRSLPLVLVVLLIAFLNVAHANFVARAQAISKGNLLAKSLGIGTLVRLQKEIARNRKCNVRLCFALDGSASLTRFEYKVQQDLVKLLASLARIGGATFSAVQYGLSNTAISKQTSNAAQFRRDVDRVPSKKASRTFVGAGLGFCISNLNNLPKGDGRKIIFLGDGRSNFFTLALPLVLRSAKDTKITAVGIGFPRNAKILTQIAGNRNRVCQVRRYGDVRRIVFKLIRSICPQKGNGGRKTFG